MITLGDVVSVLRDVPDNTFDGVLCDPPYGLAFMGKRWDYDVPGVELWAEVLRVCKPGAALLASFGTRTYHRGVVRIEDAGWEIRDSIAWMYGSGFPKSLDVSKAIDNAAGAERTEVLRAGVKAGSAPDGGVYQKGLNAGFQTRELLAPATATAPARLWSGYGTALKPAFEPYVLARKPLDGTVAENVARWGVGALAIDACMVGTGDSTRRRNKAEMGYHGGNLAASYETGSDAGRWPANVILDEGAGAALDAQTGERRSTLTGRADPSASHAHPADPSRERGSMFGNAKARSAVYADSGGASRFFYCAKASRSERDAGCGGLAPKTRAEATGRKENSAGASNPRAGAGSKDGSRNHHPTVKPLALCEYLARLIMPPKPGRLLVPFAGSGSEVIGALRAGWPDVLGIEREPEYVEIARRRVAHALATPAPKPKPKPRTPRPRPVTVILRRFEQIPLFR